ncbi:MAG TPA: creatininase family protein [Candidatus Eisenbacteria bacterium]
MERHIARLQWKEFQRLVPEKCITALLPIGILEAHGAAALGTDILIPERMSELLAEPVGALIAPTIPYGVPGSLFGYPGTIGVREDIFADYVADVLHSLASAGFRQVFILNGHGGNNEALKEVARESWQAGGLAVAVVHWWMECGDIVKEVYGGAGGHGGVDETALMLAISSDLVEKRPRQVDTPFRMRPSVVTYPAPSSLLVFEEGAAPVSFDEKKARQFEKRVAARLEEIIEEIEARWAETGFTS